MTGVLPIANGGTSATTGAAALTALGLVSASDAAEGIVELATNAEVQAGTDTTRAVTAAGFRSANIILDTAVASTSGTNVDFASVPSWAKRVTVMLDAVSTNGTSFLLVQVGAGSIQSSGYTASSTIGTGVSTSTAGFIAYPGAVAAATTTGVLVLQSMGSNKWTVMSIACPTTTTAAAMGVGVVTLSGALDRVRVTAANGTDTFDAGSINISWE